MNGLCVCFLSLLIFVITQGAVYQGQLTTPSRWHYLAKFCFSNEFHGIGNFTYLIHSNNEDLDIMLYLGTSNHTPGSGAWDVAYEKRDTATCQELKNMHRESGIKKVENGKLDYFEPTQNTRAYFWYVAVADCEAPGGLDLTYTITFLNPGGFWYRQYSYDEQGICQMYIFFTLFYTFILVFHFWCVWKLIQMESWHPIVRILTVSITFQFLSCIAEMIHYSIYLYDGIGAVGLKGLGELLSMASQLILMFLCILVSKGWAITSSQLTDRNLLILIMSLFVLSYLALFIWDNAGRDPASTLYFYDSIPGLIVILLRVGVTGWFLWCLRSTMGFEMLPEKRKFYIIFGVCYTVWFLLLPGIVAFALVLDPWYRFRTVRGMMLSADALAFLSFVILWWPTRAATFFKFKPMESLLSEDDPRSNYGTDL